MKGGVVTKLRLIIFLPSILVLWENKGSLAASIPQMHDNSQFPKFLVLDKPDGKKSLIEIVGKTGRKESVQKQAETIEDKAGGILTDNGGLCWKDEDCPKGEVCHLIPPIPMCGRPIKNAETPKEASVDCCDGFEASCEACKNGESIFIYCLLEGRALKTPGCKRVWEEECKEEKLQHHAACEYTRPMLCKDVSAYMGHCPKTCDTCDGEGFDDDF